MFLDYMAALFHFAAALLVGALILMVGCGVVYRPIGENTTCCVPVRAGYSGWIWQTYEMGCVASLNSSARYEGSLKPGREELIPQIEAAIKNRTPLLFKWTKMTTTGWPWSPSTAALTHDIEPCSLAPE